MRSPVKLSLLREVYSMVKRMTVCVALMLCFFCQGCTLHFKAKEIELDTKTDPNIMNITYVLEKLVLLDGQIGK